MKPATLALGLLLAPGLMACGFHPLYAMPDMPAGVVDTLFPSTLTPTKV